MAVPTRDERNAAAAKLLDYGFAGFSSYRSEAGEATVHVEGGVLPECHVRYEEFNALIPKGKNENVEKSIDLPDTLTAPLLAGDVVGRVTFKLSGEEIGSVPIRVTEPIEKICFKTLFCRLLSQFLLM
jgi:D-alanyl-D-alanine carboxypeptidase (penicillin-binding protein 5/6)